MGVTVQRHTAQVADDFAGAFSAIAKQRATALFTFPDAMTMAHRKEIAEFAGKLRLASVGGWSEFADAGGLMTYGPNLSTLSGVSLSTPTKFSRAPSRLIFPWNSRRSSSW
jgi:hypothetical protein